MSIADPILSAIRTALPATTVYDAHVPATPGLRYVVVYPDLGRLSSPTLLDNLIASDIIYRLVYVGTTRGEVEAIANGTRGAILRRRFTDDTYTAEFDPDDFHNTTPIKWDESIPDRVVMYATDEFKALAHK